MSSNDSLEPRLWKPRSIEETLALYRDWSGTYDADLLASGYATPTRAATALAPLTDPTAPILDFGCGTGLSGLALRDAGFTTIDGTDITVEMLELAKAKDIYREIWLSAPGKLDVSTKGYSAILAAGVVSLGAAPPETLDLLLASLPAGGHLAFSFNDPTLADPGFTGHLEQLVGTGGHQIVFRDHGPHLPEKGMGSDVIILRKA